MSRDILSSTDLIQKFRPIAKDRLFYDRFEYCLSFDVAEASALRWLDRDKIAKTIARRREWRAIGLERWLQQGNTAMTTSRHYREIPDCAESNLNLIADTVLLYGTDYKLVTSRDSAWVYTNDIKLIERLADYDFIRSLKYTRALINRPRNTICLVKPQHQQRSHWRSVRLTVQEKTNLENFFANHPDIRISPGLQGFLQGPFHRTQDYFFIDYNESSYLTMLGLICPGLIRKTSQLITA